MRHIRKSEVIDRNAPELVDLFDNLRDTLLGRPRSHQGALLSTWRHRPPG